MSGHALVTPGDRDAVIDVGNDGGLWRRMLHHPARSIGKLVSACGLALVLAVSPAHAAGDGEAVFTVGNYPVEAVANDAVAAKEKAISDGQQAAFRSLLKRLTPVTAYKALAALKSTPAANLVDGLAVRSERNSSTSYTASLDFSFDPKRVRDLLRSRGIPFVEQQAAETAVVLVYLPPLAGSGSPASLGAERGRKTWREAWTGLDLEHTLTPVKLQEPPAALTSEVVSASLTDANAPLRAIATLAKSGQALLAVAQADPAARRLHVTLTGTDAVGSFVLKRSWRLDPADAAYTAELAAVVALGTLEGRWKAVRGTGRLAALPPAGAALQPVQLYVEARGMQDWQSLQRLISQLPGVSDFSVGGLSARGADVALRYPGGGEALANALASQGIELRNAGGTWVARSAN